VLPQDRFVNNGLGILSTGRLGSVREKETIGQKRGFRFKTSIAVFGNDSQLGNFR
jgi:hypothetical protein